MSEPDTHLVLARAKLNFARKDHGERCWDDESAIADAIHGRPVLPLTKTEREEFLAQARHELRREPQSA
jgi:hypothetical protein